MDFSDRLFDVATRAQELQEHIKTEEAAKNSLVLPFIQALGYDTYDPRIVVPEFTADAGTKKGEKVDYAILKEGDPIILIECKCCGDPLDQGRANQLQRYFQNTPTARVGVLTDGIRYRFFSDLDQKNLMDPRPFMEVDFSSLDETLVPELRKLTNEKFDVENALSAAQNLKYTREIKKIFAAQIDAPSDDFVRIFASQVYSGHLRANVIDEFRDRVSQAIKMHLGEMINDRLKSAMTGLPDAVENEDAVDVEDVVADNGVVTTDEEIEGHMIVRAILSSQIAPDRVVMRDTKSYCGILLDDNNRKPLCRLHFNTGQKYIGLFDSDKNETRHPIDSVAGIYAFADQLRATPAYYE